MSKDIRKIIGKNILKFRLEKNWSQEELGFEAKLSNSTIGKYENGKRCPSIPALKRIANALGVKLDDLVD